jgi:CRISPR-associated protein Csx17
MEPVAFGGVSPRSLGDLLKGYGLIAAIGERYRATQFWWDDGFHLVAELPVGVDKTVEELLDSVPEWAGNVARGFARTRQKSCDKPLPCPDHPQTKKKGTKKTCPIVLAEATDSPLKSGGGHDALDSTLAAVARAVAVPRGEGDRNAEPHPWFPGYGQESSGNYFNKLAEAAGAARQSASDLTWSLYGVGAQPVQKVVDKGYLFFPEPMTRYATGGEKWEQEKAAVPAWDFLLALRGALLLRGSLRRPRWRHAGYPAFPFVFEGGGVVEVHLPTWSSERPRTRRELELQVRQFHAPLAQDSFAVTAGEFRAAVQNRGPAVGFDAFHRFVVELRRPGQQQRLPQAIPRGLTRVKRLDVDVDLRRMIAPLGESGWVDQFMLPRRKNNEDDRTYTLEARRRLDEAIHGAIDEPTVDSYLGILEAVWELNGRLLLPGKLRRIFKDDGRTPRPAPPLPATQWDRALAPGLAHRAEWRLARAIGSIVGVRGDGGRAVGPILEHLLPVQYRWDRATWIAPETASASATWSGRVPLRDFQSLLWRRWLASGGLGRVPFAGARPAPVDDVLRLLRGEVNVHEVHRLTPLFALLAWQNVGPAATPGAAGHRLPLSPAYAALHLWLELGIAPCGDARPPRDGEVPRLVSLGGIAYVEHAVERALARLRVEGLPWHERPAPMGKAVATARPRLTQMESGRLALAVMVPISRADTLALARRFWVAVTEKEISA